MLNQPSNTFFCEPFNNLDHDLDFTATAISRRAFATGAICNRTCENLNPCFNIPLSYDDPRMRNKLVNIKIDFRKNSSEELLPLFNSSISYASVYLAMIF